MTDKERRQKEFLLKKYMSEGKYFSELASESLKRASDYYRKAAVLKRELDEAKRPRLQLVRDE
jgi:uncharacterized tellurite resistance protein B-like protein